MRTIPIHLAPMTIYMETIHLAQLAIAATTRSAQLDAISRLQIHLLAPSKVNPPQGSISHLAAEIADSPGAITTTGHTVWAVYAALRQN